MEIYTNSLMESLYYDASYADENFPCVVKLDDEAIHIEYVSDGNLTIYKGRSIGTGHYELKCPEVKGKATLHKFNTSEILEGSWIENQTRGMWRIHLIK